MEKSTVLQKLSEISCFLAAWSKFLNDPAEQSAAKQSYFLDQQEDIRKILIMVDTLPVNFPDDEDVTVPCAEYKNIIQQTVNSFRNSMGVNENATEADTTAIVTEETMTKAMQTNKTTQRMVSDMNALEKQQQATAAAASTPYTHLLVIDNMQYFIAAKTKEELETVINEQAEAQKQAKTFALYEINLKQITLSTKTVIAIA